MSYLLCFVVVSSMLMLIGTTQARLMFMELSDEAGVLRLSKHMDNQHIVLMGDCVMRSQYLALTHLIHYSKLIDPDEIPNILLSTSQNAYPDLRSFLNASHSVLAKYEYCDCSVKASYDHRYYYNPVRNISISYIGYAGDHKQIGGGWMPTADTESNHREHPPGDYDNSWPEHRIQDTITNIAAKLTPKPSVLVLNAGHWDNDWHLVAHRDSVLTLAKSLFPRVIWKTTNYIQAHTVGKWGTHDPVVCAYPGVECLNLNWTQYLDPSQYDDSLHLKPTIYNDVAIQFLIHMFHKPLLAVPLSSEYYGSIVKVSDKQYVVDNIGILRPFLRPILGDCVTRLAARQHVHIPAIRLLNHILGEYVDICQFV